MARISNKQIKRYTRNTIRHIYKWYQQNYKYVIEDGVLVKIKVAANVTKLVIPNNVTSIGSRAGESLKHIESIDIPDGVTSIGQCAFVNCTNLKTVNINSACLTNIGQAAFYGCGNLTTVKIKSCTTIEKSAFGDCTALKEIELPNGLLTIDEFAFSNCSSLQRVDLPDSLQTISKAAFCKTTSLEEITIPDNIDAIEDWTFCHSGLKKIRMPLELKRIGECAFYDCSRLIQINYDGNKNQMPDNLCYIGKHAFRDCTALRSINFNNNNRISDLTIDKCAFIGCQQLNEITESFTAIDFAPMFIYDHAFRGCPRLNKIDLDTVTYISTSAFSHCENLREIYLLRIAYIGQHAFRECENLLDANLASNSLNTIDDAAFFACRKLTNTVFSPNINMHRIGKNAFQDCGVENTIDGKVNVDFRIEKVDTAAFANCQFISKINLNYDAVIENMAFMKCNWLQDVRLNQYNDFDVNPYVFYDCKNLKRIEFRKNPNNIYEAAFAKQPSIERIVFAENSDSDGSIPNLTNTNAFYKTADSLKIVVPDEQYDNWRNSTNWNNNRIKTRIVKWTDA